MHLKFFFGSLATPEGVHCRFCTISLTGVRKPYNLVTICRLTNVNDFVSHLLLQSFTLMHDPTLSQIMGHVKYAAPLISFSPLPAVRQALFT